MLKYFKTILIFFLFFSTSFNLIAEDIPKEFRVKNRPPGYCGWCCLETLGKLQGVKELDDLAQNREKDKDLMLITPNGLVFIPKHAASVYTVREKMQELKVPFTYKINYDPSLITEATKHTCVIFIKERDQEVGHAVILTQYNEKEIHFIDPNDCKEYIAKQAWIDYYWTGISIRLNREEIKK